MADVRIRITGENDASSAVKGVREDLDKLKDSVKNTSGETEKGTKSLGSFSDVLGKIAAAGLLVKIGQQALEFGKASVQAAGDAAEMQSKFDVVFGESAPAAQAALEDLSGQVNRSATDLQTMAASVQDTFVPLGFARDAAANLSVELTKLAVDVGSFNNVADADVMRDFQSALVGNTETVRKYGIVITEANTKQKAYEMGLADVGEKLTEQQKVQARLQLIMEGTTDAQGDAIRTADSYANTQKGLEAATKDLQIALGNLATKSLAGVNKEATILVSNLTDLVGWVNKLEEASKDHNVAVLKTSDSYEEYTAEIVRAAVATGTIRNKMGDYILEVVNSDQATQDYNATIKYEIETLGLLTKQQYYAVSAAMRLNDEGGKLADGFRDVSDTAVELSDNLEVSATKANDLSIAFGDLAKSLDFTKQVSSLLNDAIKTQGDSTYLLNLAQIDLLYYTGQITEAERADLIEKNKQIGRLDKLTKALDAGRISYQEYLKVIADGVVTQGEMRTTVGATYIEQQTLNGQIDAGVSEMEDLYGVTGTAGERFAELHDEMKGSTEKFDPFIEKALKAHVPLTSLAGATNGLAEMMLTAGQRAKTLDDSLGDLAARDGDSIDYTVNIHTNGSIPNLPTAGGGHQGQGGTNATGFAGGADFVVPPGYPNDSFGPLYVQSGEHVQVTPAGESASSMGGMTVVQVFLDGQQIAARVNTLQGQQTRLNKQAGYAYTGR